MQVRYLAALRPDLRRIAYRQGAFNRRSLRARAAGPRLPDRDSLGIMIRRYPCIQIPAALGGGAWLARSTVLKWPIFQRSLPPPGRPVTG